MNPQDDVTPHDEEARELAQAAEALREGHASDEQIELLGGKRR